MKASNRYFNSPPSGATAVGPAKVLDQRFDGTIPVIAVVAFIFLVFVGLTPFGETEADPSQIGDQGSTLRQALFFLISVTLFALARSKQAADVEFPLTLAAAVGWCWLSLAWSIEPSVALRRVGFSSLVLISAYLTIRILGPTLFVRVFAACLAAVIVADVISGFLIPQAVQTAASYDSAVPGSWRGIHLEKNAAGAIAAVAMIVHFFRFIDTKRWSNLAITVLALFFLIQTKSKTSLGLTPIAIFFGLYLRFIYTNKFIRGLTSFGAIIAVVAAAFTITIFFHEVTDFFLSDPEAFTGRTEIWNVLLSYSAEHPILGSGYGSFWGIGALSPAYTYGGWVTENIFVGHNGYLDTLAQLGTVGFILTMIALVVIPIIYAFRKTDANSRQANAMPLAIIIFAILHNFQETSFLERENALWVSMLLAIFIMRSTPRTAPIVAPEASPPTPKNKFRIKY